MIDDVFIFLYALCFALFLAFAVQKAGTYLILVRKKATSEHLFLPTPPVQKAIVSVPMEEIEVYVVADQK